MKDTFQWTPELLADFFNSTKILPVDLANGMEQFKSSKAPKKEWEIMAFRHARGTMDVYKLREDGKYRSDETYTGWGFTMEEMIKDEEIIHSVRRLSDGEVFSCKEKVGTPYAGQYVIHSFAIEENEMIARFTNGHPSNGYCNIKALKKLPAPVLTTVDGAGIMEDQPFWVVGDDCQLSERTAGPASPKYIRDGDNIFSTREAAEHYILNNRPLLSLNDVKEAAGVSYDDHVYTSVLFEKLTALVKQKLNP